MIGANAAHSDPLALKPFTKARSEQNLPIGRFVAVSLLNKPLSKRADISSERPFGRSRKNYLTIDNAIHGGLLPRLCGLLERAKIMST
jgi:hypothetical protein